MNPYFSLAALAILGFSVQHGNCRKCGIETCHKTLPGKINVHIIPHTHDDVGWLKTVDQYYYGSNNGHAPYGVQYILDSVVSELQKNKDRRFVYVETSFFWRWWEEQDEQNKKIVHQLVEEGRLEFLHGGWCMSDEATPHYSSMIDQMTFGLKFLNDTFGECGRPLMAWQIDPFGHSSEVGIEFAEMGFNGVIVSRIDYEDHELRKRNKHMEVIWRPDTSLGEDGELFFGVLYDMYTAPAGFCFDTYCNTDPIMDNKKLHDYNVDTKVSRFVEYVRNYSAAYKTNHFMLTMGGDFNYVAASPWFKNIDKLIKYVHAKHDDIHLLYSTPSCYVNTINAYNTTWPTHDDDDFFPYGSDEHSYWTGYYTSRPSLKYLVYKANNLLQAIKQLSTSIQNDLIEEETLIKRALAISQHHDAVSGTEKQHVTNDYALYIHEGINASQSILTKVYKTKLGSEYPHQHLCGFLNISQCALTENSSNFVITIYNPQGHSVDHIVKVPVGNSQFKVFRSDGTEIPHEIIPVPSEIFSVPGRNSVATNELIFAANKLPQLGATSFYVEQIPSQSSTPLQPSNLNSTNTVVIENGIVKLIFNKTSGLLQTIIKDGFEWNVTQNFYYYEGTKGYNYNAQNRASGAYIFRPTATEPKLVSESVNITRVYVGKNVREVHQNFSEWLTQIVRLYDGKEDVEFQWLVGPIPVAEWIGKEVVTRYTTNLATNSTFYTDSNGRRWIKRIRNYRKYWNLTITEPVSCNYYPVTTAVCIKNATRQFTVLTDRPEGATSMNDGQIELMLHRRLLYDDYKGVSEPLDETAYGQGLVVRGSHIVQINPVERAAKQHRTTAASISYAPIISFAKASGSLAEYLSKYKKEFSLVKTELPLNIHLLTLERWRENTFLIRLEHLFQKGEDPKLSVPQTVNLQELFSFEITNIEELTLAANLPKKDLNRLKWRTEDNSSNIQLDPYKSCSSQNLSECISIQLQPMQIRTFLITGVRIFT